MSYEIKTDPEVISKTAFEEVKKEFDFSGVDVASGEVISSVTSVTADPSGLTISGLLASGLIAQCLITGGVAGVVYKLVCRVVTSSSQKLEQSGLLYVGNP